MNKPEEKGDTGEERNYNFKYPVCSCSSPGGGGRQQDHGQIPDSSGFEKRYG